MTMANMLCCILESGTSLTSWSAWLGCECNMESRKTESRRFRLCLSVIKPRLYKEACRNLESAAEYQTRMCQHDLCGGEFLQIRCGVNMPGVSDSVNLESYPILSSI